MTNTNRYEIVYDSDFIISDPVELSTLCVFYDKVYLPCCLYTQHPELSHHIHNAQSKRDLEYPFPKASPPPGFQRGQYEWEKEIKWVLQNKQIFDEGVMEICEFPSDLISEWSINKLKDQFKKLGRKALTVDMVIDQSTGEIISEKMLLYAYHKWRSDLISPRLSTNCLTSLSRVTKKTLLANQAFRYYLPGIKALQPEQVLEVREKVVDFRRGFSMHLQALSADIDAQLKGGESAEEIRRYAQNVMETKFEPQYVEFKRKLDSIKVRKAGKIADVVGRAFEIDASMLSPKFWVDVLKLGKDVLQGGAEELYDSLSNERQAYHFMHLVEGTKVNSE